MALAGGSRMPSFPRARTAGTAEGSTLSRLESSATTHHSGRASPRGASTASVHTA